MSFAYQWKRNGAAIAGATAQTYVLVAADIGASISGTVTATNTTGLSTSVTSAAVGPVTSSSPVNAAVPVISGTPTQGSILTTSQGTWSNTPTAYAYQWTRAGANISGATASAYTLVAGDVGANIAVTVTASNVYGTASASAVAVGPVTVAVPYAGYALALDFKQQQYRVGATYGTSITALSGYAYTRSGAKGELNLSGTRLYGPELLVNGSFDTDVAGWTSTGLTAAWNSGSAILTKTADGNSYSQVNPSLTSGKYRLQGRLTVSERARIQLPGGAFTNSNPFVTSVPGTFNVDVELTAAVPSGNIDIGVGLADLSVWAANGATVSIEYLSLKRIIDGVSYVPANTPGIVPGVGYWSRGALTNPTVSSQAFDAAIWSKTQWVVTPDATTAPDGTSTADQVADTAFNSDHWTSQNFSATAATVYTYSCFAKAGSATAIQLALGLTSYCNFNLSTGTVGTSSGATGTIINCGNGWYRCIIVATAAATATIQTYLLLTNSNASAAIDPTYVGTGQTCFVWQAQTIAGNFPDGGPIIATTTTAASIGADALATTVNPYTTDQDFAVWVVMDWKKHPEPADCYGLFLGGNVYLGRDSQNRSRVAADGVSDFGNAGGFFVNNRVVLLYRRKAGKTSFGYKFDDGSTVVTAETVAAWGAKTSALQVGFNVTHAAVEGVFAQTGTFSDAQITAILAGA